MICLNKWRTCSVSASFIPICWLPGQQIGMKPVLTMLFNALLWFCRFWYYCCMLLFLVFVYVDFWPLCSHLAQLSHNNRRFVSSSDLRISVSASHLCTKCTNCKAAMELIIQTKIFVLHSLGVFMAHSVHHKCFRWHRISLPCCCCCCCSERALSETDLGIMEWVKVLF